MNLKIVYQKGHRRCLTVWTITTVCGIPALPLLIMPTADNLLPGTFIVTVNATKNIPFHRKGITGGVLTERAVFWSQCQEMGRIWTSWLCTKKNLCGCRYISPFGKAILSHGCVFHGGAAGTRGIVRMLPIYRQKIIHQRECSVVQKYKLLDANISP